MLSETIKINLNFDDFFYMEWCNFDKINFFFFYSEGSIYLFICVVWFVSCFNHILKVFN